jgi:polyferredoxin
MISRNKVVVPEGAAGLSTNFIQIISVSWVFIYAELLCRAIRHDLILLIGLLFILFTLIFIEESFWLSYCCDLIVYTIVYLYCEG